MDNTASGSLDKFTDFAVLANLSRLETLQRTAILDTAPEEVFDRLTALASKLLNAPVTLLSLVDARRQFFKSQFGLPEPWATERETALSYSFCKHAVASGEPLIISDARRHPLLHKNLAVTEVGVIAYAGIPLQASDGSALGSFCAIDMQPRHWTPQEIEVLRSLASAAMSEIELRLTVRQLQESQERLKTLERLREEMTSLIIHDLRTPLTSLLLGLQAVEMSGELNDDQRQWSAIAHRNGSNMIAMINDLLDVSKNEGGATGLVYKTQSACEAIDNVLLQVKPLANAKKIKLDTEIAPGLPQFSADAGKLLRVLVNLIGNAITFTPEGGEVTVSVCPGPDETLHFAVRDTGIGIPPEEFENIFDKFRRVAGAEGRRETSGGLGLTLCKTVVEAHGGRIWLESQVGQGSTFHFTLPLAPQS